jgi:molybdopterin adenylyltransferase
VESLRVAILTVSDGVAARIREDRSGAAIARWCRAGGRDLIRHDVVADDVVATSRALIGFADVLGADLVITTGGTGFTERDITPEATLAVIDRAAPGIAEAIRARGATATSHAWLSRAVAGIRGRTLIVNLPGSEGGVRDGLAVLDDIVDHAVQLLRNIDTGTHPPPDRASVNFDG